MSTSTDSPTPEREPREPWRMTNEASDVLVDALERRYGTGVNVAAYTLGAVTIVEAAVAEGIVVPVAPDGAPGAIPEVPKLDADTTRAYDRLRSFGGGLSAAVASARRPTVERDIITVLSAYGALDTYVAQVRAAPIIARLRAPEVPAARGDDHLIPPDDVLDVLSSATVAANDVLRAVMREHGAGIVSDTALRVSNADTAGAPDEDRYASFAVWWDAQQDPDAPYVSDHDKCRAAWDAALAAAPVPAFPPDAPSFDAWWESQHRTGREPLFRAVAAYNFHSEAFKRASRIVWDASRASGAPPTIPAEVRRALIAYVGTEGLAAPRDAEDSVIRDFLSGVSAAGGRDAEPESEVMPP